MLHKIGWLLFIGFFLGVVTSSWFAYDPKSVNASPGRSLSTTGSNNTFVISTSRFAMASYTVNFSASLTLGTSNGKVELDYSLDGGTTWTTVASVSQVFGISITITTNQNLVLNGIIPPNALVRIYSITASSVTITLGNEEESLI